MTASTVPNTNNPLRSPAKRPYRFSVIRVILCGVMMAILCVGCLYVQYTSMDFFHTQLLEQDKKTTAWIVEQLRFSLPFILICVFQYAVYARHYRSDGIAQREMAWEILLCAVLVYGVVLPCLASLSDALYHMALALGADIPQTDAKVDLTLLMELHEWFVRLSFPMVLLFLYHSARGYHETHSPEDHVEEIPLTVEEYETLCAAERAEREIPLVVEGLPTSSDQAPAEEQGEESHE